MAKNTRFVGLDVHAETIAVAVAEGRGQVRSLGTIPNRGDAVERVLKKLGKPNELRVCYEAGPTGYALYWQLTSMGIACEVIAPSLAPTKPGDRVKTDRRDAERLARSYQSGDLTVVWVPDAKHALAARRADYGLFDALPVQGRSLFRACSSLSVRVASAPHRFLAPKERWHRAGHGVQWQQGLVHWRYSCSKFVRQTFVEWAAQTIPRSFWAKSLLRVMPSSRRTPPSRPARPGIQMDPHPAPLLARPRPV
jgi:hypothetical protein